PPALRARVLDDEHALSIICQSRVSELNGVVGHTAGYERMSGHEGLKDLPLEEEWEGIRKPGAEAARLLSRPVCRLKFVSACRRLPLPPCHPPSPWMSCRPSRALS